jgi:hypothetical protein
MKHLIIVMLILGTVLIFFSCQQDSVLPTELSQNDQTISALEKPEAPFGFKGTEFTGECTKTSDPDFEEVPGVSHELPNGKMLLKGRTTVWHDSTSDARVTGNTYWYIDEKDEVDGTFKYRGKAELFVDNDVGLWQISWHGYLNENGLIAEGVGQGKEGAVKGLVAKWTYTFDFVNFKYDIVGYIKD